MSFNDLARGGGGHSVPPAQNNEFTLLTQKISQNIFKISANVAAIRKCVDNLGSPRDTSENRDKLHEITETTRVLIKNTNSELRNLGNLNGSSTLERGNYRMEHQKLSRDFQQVLERFQVAQNLSAQKSRDYVARAKTFSPHLEELDDGETSETQPLMEVNTKALNLKALNGDIEFNEQMIIEREQEIRDIERGIHEINEIFRDMGTIVTEQQSLLDNIESNVQTVAVNMEGAVSELTSASDYQKKARKRACCLFVLFLVVALIILLLVIS